MINLTLKVNLDVKGNFSFLISVSLLYCCFNRGLGTSGGYLLLIFRGRSKNKVREHILMWLVI